jgi:hypothetical protein
MHTDIHILSGIRTHDPSFRADEDSAWIRPRGYCDRPRNANGPRTYEERDAPLTVQWRVEESNIMRYNAVERLLFLNLLSKDAVNIETI